MGNFKPGQEVSEFNYAVMAEHGQYGNSLVRNAYFGSAQEFATWLDSFDFQSGDVFGWKGDQATMNAVDSFRKNGAFISVEAIPEFITEYNTNTGASEIIGADQFSQLRRMFQKDPDYVVHRHFAGNAKVHSVMFIGKGEARLSSYVWHVPFGSDCAYE